GRGGPHRGRESARSGAAGGTRRAPSSRACRAARGVTRLERSGGVPCTATLAIVSRPLRRTGMLDRRVLVRLLPFVLCAACHAPSATPAPEHDAARARLERRLADFFDT